jgi:hypothetical protein
MISHQLHMAFARLHRTLLETKTPPSSPVLFSCDFYALNLGPHPWSTVATNRRIASADHILPAWEPTAIRCRLDALNEVCALFSNGENTVPIGVFA